MFLRKRSPPFQTSIHFVGCFIYVVSVLLQVSAGRCSQSVRTQSYHTLQGCGVSEDLKN